MTSQAPWKKKCHDTSRNSRHTTVIGGRKLRHAACFQGSRPVSAGGRGVGELVLAGRNQRSFLRFRKERETQIGPQRSSHRPSFVPKRCRLCTRPFSGARSRPTSRASTSPASGG